MNKYSVFSPKIWDDFPQITGSYTDPDPGSSFLKETIKLCCLFCSRVGSLLCLTNRILICRNFIVILYINGNFLSNFLYENIKKCRRLLIYGPDSGFKLKSLSIYINNLCNKNLKKQFAFTMHFRVKNPDLMTKG